MRNLRHQISCTLPEPSDQEEASTTTGKSEEYRSAESCAWEARRAYLRRLGFEPPEKIQTKLLGRACTASYLCNDEEKRECEELDSTKCSDLDEELLKRLKGWGQTLLLFDWDDTFFPTTFLSLVSQIDRFLRDFFAKLAAIAVTFLTFGFHDAVPCSLRHSKKRHNWESYTS
jgi:hypothetical protein